MNSNQHHSVENALHLWAQKDAGDADAINRIIHHADVVSTPSRKWMAWSVGAVAACVALGLAIIPSIQPPAAPPTDPLGAAVQLAALSEEEQASFDLLYTPTQDEEYVI